jgi:hypothetical protein
MPHSFDFDELERKLFFLKHVCLGSATLCKEINLNRTIYNGEDYEWWEYTGILKSIVSEILIGSAIKIRMIQDLVKSEDDEINLTELDRQSISCSNIGEFVNSSRNLSLRESCNKIIHATEAKLQWVNVDLKNQDSNEYWNGRYELWGKNRGNGWHLQLNVPEWCSAMIRFNKNIQEAVDWYHIYKHDE